MSNRLTQIATRTGDDGTTGLGDGTRVAKHTGRVAAYGTVDEANSAIGVLLQHVLRAVVRLDAIGTWPLTAACVAAAGWKGTCVMSTLASDRNSNSAPRWVVVPLPEAPHALPTAEKMPDWVPA